MRLLRILACAASLTVTGQSEAAVSHHTKVRAEQNILSARGMLGRWHVGLIDRRTALPRNNVWARCSGRGVAVDGRHTHFGCTIGYHRIRVTVTYLALQRYGFEIRNRRTSIR